jgi:hypothetical protein
MKKLATGVSFIALFGIIIGSAFLLLSATAKEPPFLPGLTVKDTTPNGCVDCHKLIDAKHDYRLNVGLAQNDEHPDITKIVKKVPTDCFMCHKEGTKAGPLQTQLHKVHYQKPAENPFVTMYNGACLNCHALKVETGIVSVKTGDKNW